MDENSTQDNDFRTGFASLKTSTAAIEKHAKIIEAQREALLAFKPQEDTTNQPPSFSRQNEQESSRLIFELADLLHSTKAQLSEAEQQSNQAIQKLNSIATERLAADDQVLEALSGLAAQALRPQETSVNIETAEKWCQALASLREQEARARVEIIYHDELSRETQNDHSEMETSATENDMNELQEELQTLRSEIGSIVQMVIGHEIRDPLLRNIQSHENHSTQSRMEWSEYVTSTLEHLIAQLETISDQAVDLRSYTSAIHEFRPLISATETESYPQQSVSSSATNAASSPSENSSNKSKFLESRSATTVSAIPQVLRRLDQDQDLTASSPRSEVLQALGESTMESISKLRAQYSAAESATLENLEKSLGEKQRDVRGITQKIHANSDGSDEVILIDKALDAKLQGLNDSVDEIAMALEKTNMSLKDQPAVRSSVLKSRWLVNK
ncbi:hypothetical protein EJ08DRAFT_56715 [Tothia fuscella]|uniref:Uncharacterized protein n=1 Tax=Tothia fuscella TaxID=1048955 RepID=A0A9P4NWA9_9PEZI|nr:hypothetical protein EJ08DRAFT_56715 [Tothia fuscella]